MTASIRFYRDQDNQLRVQAVPEYSTLADYLESDLQDAATTAEVLQKLETVAADGDQEVSGNSYTLVLQPELLTLENLFDDTVQPYQLATAQGKLLLAAWAAFLASDNLLSLVPDFRHPPA